MQINKRQTTQSDTIRNLIEGVISCSLQAKSSPIIPSHCGLHVSPGKSKNPEPSVKDHTVLDDGISMEDKSKIPIGNRKRIFWQTSINDQRPKLRVHINGIVIVCLIDTGVDVSIITLET